MKRKTLLSLLAVALISVALISVQAGPIVIPSVSVAGLTGDVAVLQGQMSTTTSNVAVLQGQIVAQSDTNQIVAQSDTNVTTTATTYTPRFKGDTLIGGAGAGTNAVWIAKGTTTNDWIAVKP